MTGVDPSELNRMLAKISKEYPGITRKGNEYQDPQRISTGSFELDLVTGGGYPMGRIIHEYGGQFSAKTLIAYKVIANAQKMGQVAVLFDAEKQFSEKWAAQHGIDTEKLIVFETTIIEEIGTIMESMLGVAHLFVIDSIPACVSIDEVDTKTEEWRPGIGARAWGKTLRRVQERFDARENTIILINHVGMVFGKYGGGEEPKGAKFIEYLSSLSLEFRRSSWLFRGKDGNLKPDGDSEQNLSGDKNASGIEFQVKIKKSRVCPPLQSSRIRLDFKDGTIDDTWSFFKAAVLYGVVDKPSPGWYVLPGTEKKIRETEVRAAIESDEKLREQIIEAIKGND